MQAASRKPLPCGLPGNAERLADRAPRHLAIAQRIDVAIELLTGPIRDRCRSARQLE